MALTDKLKAIGDALREKNGTLTKYKLDEIPQAIKSIKVNNGWVRPAEWPNLDALDLSAYDDCYVYTMDNSNKCDYNWFSHRIGVSPTNNGKVIHISQGTIGSDGSFILEKEYDEVRTDKFFYTSIYDYPVFIVTTAPGYSITQALVDGSPNYPGGGSAQSQYIKTLEMRIKATNSTNLGNTTARLGGAGLKRIKIENFTNATSMLSNFEGYYLLEEIVFESCDFSNVTNWNNVFRNCTSIKDWNFVKDIDFSNGTTFISLFSGSSYDGTGDTTIRIPNATNISSMFQGCPNLKELDLSQCGAVNKTITTATAMFQNNYVLENLDCSGLDFTNLSSTSSLFTSINNLKRFKLCKGLTISFTFSNFIDYNDLIQMINDLETVTTSPTWSIGNLKYYLTQADKDKITAKGWLIA